MPKRKNTPEWTKTGVVWETKVLVWDRMAKGDSDTQIGDWLDRQKAPINDETLHLDRDTIALVRKELEKLPEGLAKGLPENTYGYWHSLQRQDEKTSPVINTQLLPNKTAEKSNIDLTTQDNTPSESPQIKDEHFEQDKTPSANMNAQPSPTITEEIKHESLPPEDAVTESNTQVNDNESSETASKERATPSPEEKSDICIAPPDNIDVNVLKSWGVPLGKRAEIISQWLYWHKQGRHDICQIFPRLKEDITVRRFPFIEAERLRMADIWATKYHIEDFRADLNLYRTYRPQEHPKSYQVFIRDVQERCKPIYETRQKHLSDVENLLRELRDAVLNSMETKKYDSLLKMEENPLFESIQTHCYDVYDFFWDLKRNLESAQYLKSDTKTSEIDKTMDNSKAKELLKLQKDTITSLKQLGKAIDSTLKNKSYSKEWCSDCYHDATIETNS